MDPMQDPALEPYAPWRRHGPPAEPHPRALLPQEPPWTSCKALAHCPAPVETLIGPLKRTILG